MKRKFLFILFLLCFSGQFIQAQISIGALPYTYSNNFDTYAGNAGTLPTGWAVIGGCTYRGTGNGSGTSGGYWAYGASGEFNLGVLASGSCSGPGYTVTFQNSSGATITELTISYNFDQWRYAGGNTNGFTVTQTGIGASVSGLDQNSNPSGTNGTPTVTPKSITLTGLNIPNGNTFTLTFATSDGTGSDNGFGIDDFSLQAVGTSVPPCTEPTAQPTSLVLTPGSYHVNGSFMGSMSANGYLVVASTSATLGASPVDGTTYAVGDVIGSGNVVYNGTGTSFTVAGLNPSTTYYFFVFAYNSGGACTINYLTTSPLSGNATTAGPLSGSTLAPGDMVFVAYDNLANSISNGADYLAVSNLVPLSPGTKFLIANCTYETGAKPTAFQRTNTWHTSSTTPTGNVPYMEITYAGASNLPAGSIICIVSPNRSDNQYVTVRAKTFSGDHSYFLWQFRTANGGTANSGNINVSTSQPDPLFLLQGTFVYNAAGSTLSGRVLGGIQDGGTWFELSDDLSMIPNGDNNLRRSRRHPDIECFSIQAATTPSSHAARYNFSTTTGSQHVLLGAIADFTNNWIVYSPGNSSIIDWGNEGVGDSNDPACTQNTCACPKDKLTVSSYSTDGQWIGNVSTDWFDCRNWDNLQVPNQTINVSIPASAFNDCHVDRTSPRAQDFGFIAKCNNIIVSGRKLEVDLLADTLDVFGNLTISSTGSIDMNDGNAVTIDGLIRLRGNWTNNVNNAAFDEGLRSRVHFVGTSAQSINAAQPETFGQIELDNANGLTLNQVTQVQEFFKFVNGKVFNNGTNYLDIMPFDPVNSLQGYDANKYVVGKLRREVVNGQTYDFPVGTNSNYQLATIVFGASPLGVNELDASFSTTIGGTPPSIIEGSWVYNTMANGGIWTIEPPSGTFSGTYDITLNLQGSTNAQNQCIVVKRPNSMSAWTNPGTAAGCTNGSALVSSRTGLNAFSDFGIAVSNTPFPVEWLDFNATLLPNKSVQLVWATASELQNSHFNVQRSTDALNFQNLGQVQGNGTTFEISNYQFLDVNPKYGRNFYRLEQVDVNGNVHYSNVLEVFVQDVETALLVYPNPTNDFIHFVLPNTAAELSIYDLTGNLVYSTSFNDKLTVSLKDFSQGLYQYRIQTTTTTLVGKFVRQ